MNLFLDIKTIFNAILEVLKEDKKAYQYGKTFNIHNYTNFQF